MTSFLAFGGVSIIYRAVGVLVALCCIAQSSRNRVQYGTSLRIFLIILGLMTAKVVYHCFFGDYAHTYLVNSKNQSLLFAFGVVWLPLIAIIKSYGKINDKKVLTIMMVCLVLMMIKALVSLQASEVSSDGRYQLNEHQSTLAFGDNGAMLAILSATIIAKAKNITSKYKKLIICFSLFALVIGMMSILKAGSRGPLVSCMAALAFVFLVMRAQTKFMLIIAILCCLFFGLLSMDVIAEYAPALVDRMTNTIEDGDTSGRDVIFLSAWGMIMKSPILGSNPLLLFSNGFGSFHNVYLSIGVGLGVVGMVAFVILIINLLVKTIMLRKNITSIFNLFIIAMFWFFAIRGVTGIYILSNGTYCAVLALTCLILNRASISNRGKLRYVRLKKN